MPALRVALVSSLLLAVACGAPPPDEFDGGALPPDASAAGGGGGGWSPDASTGGGTQQADAGHSDAGHTDAGQPDAGRVDGGLTVAVSHTREFRGLWVATVSNLDFPASVAGKADAGIAELGRMVDTAQANGFNALVFQVRPESDAFYHSTRDPWSRFLTGTQGNDPGYDPLGELIALAHARGIEVHAWVNPYRAKTSSSAQTASTHISRVLSQNAINYAGATVMDPSAPAVRAWVTDEIGDLVDAYDVDGVHFDDYFYPYPDGTTPFPDDAQYAAYKSQGGAMSKSDWRRDNVNQLVRDVSQAIAQRKPWVRFGISPFGIYKPGTPPGITGLNAWEAISCDSLAWLQNGWVDYLAPQLYWPSTQTGQRFDLLIDWWAAQVGEGQHIFAGHALYKLGTSAAWSLDELRTEVSLTRAAGPGAAGSLWFRYANLRDDLGGCKTLFSSDLYPTPALPPVVAKATALPVTPPTATLAGQTVHLAHPAPATLRAFSVYRLELGLWRLNRVVASGPMELTLPSGRWAIAAVDRAEQESRALVVDVP